MMDKKDRIEYLKREIFVLEMKDRLDYVDFNALYEMKRELKELEDEDR